MTQIIQIGNVKQSADLDATDQLEGQNQAGGSGSSFRTSLGAVTEAIAEIIQVPIDNVVGLTDDQARQDTNLTTHETAEDPHPQYLLPEELPQTAVSYLSAAPHPVYPAEYTLLHSSTPTLPESTISTVVNTADVLCGSFVRDPAFAQDVVYAEVETRVVIDLDGESENTFVYAQALHRPGGGGPDVILGTSSPQMLTATRAQYVLPIQILGPVDVTAGDYTVIQVYGTKDGTGTARTVSIYVDGVGTSRAITYLPIPAFPAAHAISHDPGGTDELTSYLTKDVAVQTFAFAGYGGMAMSAQTAFADLGATWDVVDVFDIVTPAIPRGITLNILESTFSFDNPGVYVFALSGAFEHDSSATGRTTNLRIYDVTTGAATGNGLIVPTGRNAEATTITATLFVEVLEANVGDAFRIEIGNGDTYITVSFNALDLSLWNIGEWRGALPDPGP